MKDCVVKGMLKLSFFEIVHSLGHTSYTLKLYKKKRLYDLQDKTNLNAIWDAHHSDEVIAYT